MRRLNLIMPMGGGGTRFGNHGFNVPKPLIEIYGKPFFYWATQSIVKKVEIESLTFVVLQNHVDEFDIVNQIYKYYPQAKINIIPEVLPGAVMTCLQGIANISDEQPILFNDCDHMFLCRAFYDFCEKEEFSTIDGGLLTFESEDARFSYVAYDEYGYVNRTVEKQVISKDAICGAYYFRNKKIFEEAVNIYLKNCSYKEFFVSGVYNIMAKNRQKIRSYNTDMHVSFGTPEEFEAAQTSTEYLLLE